MTTVDRPAFTGFRDVVVDPLIDTDDLTDALAVLDEAEAHTDAPLVDEAERVRLRAAADGADLDEHHHAVLARRGGRCIGYAGLVVPPADAHGTADVAVPRGADRCDDVLRALLAAVDELARRHDAHGTRVWIREATPPDVVAAVAAGYAVERRLAVLGLDVDAHLDAITTDVDAPPGVHIDSARADQLDEVVGVLDAAYRDSPDGGWDRERFDEIAARDWFSLDDLLVATDEHDRVIGVHWTKRRGPDEGEVFNLAVAPEARGRSLGRALLRAGVAHLAGKGCHTVLLWVDLANEAAVRLYVTAGFEARWEDIALVRHVRAERDHTHPHAHPEP